MTAARILGVAITALPLLALVLGASAGFLLGHRTARVVHVPIGATAAEDEAALSAHDEQLVGEWRAHLDQLLDTYDPDTTKDHDA